MKFPFPPLQALPLRARHLIVDAGAIVLVACILVAAILARGEGSDSTPPFNGQILRKNFEPTGTASVITVSALDLPAEDGYLVAFADWQTGETVLEAVVLGERTSQFALPHTHYRVVITPFLARNGVPRKPQFAFATASPFIVGASELRKPELRFDVARALGRPGPTSNSEIFASHPKAIEK